MADDAPSATRRWGRAWVGLALALALHVTDEALTGFLPLYNSTVGRMRESAPWLPLPTFTFPVWLTGLALLVLVLLLASPLVFRGESWLRPVSYGLGVLMTANAIGHAAASVYLGRLAPGVLSSPLLLAAALTLLLATARARRSRGWHRRYFRPESELGRKS